MGVMMRRKFLTVLLLLSLLAPLAASANSPWKAGYDFSLGGIAHSTMSERDTYSGRFTWRLFQEEGSVLHLSGGLMTTSLFIAPVEYHLDTSLSFLFLLSSDHPLERFMMRGSSWYGGVEVGLLSPVKELPALKIYGSCSPFVLFFGEKWISVGSPMIVWDLETGKLGWGVTLLRITHYLW